MPDLTAGTTIKGVDWPVAVYEQDTTTIANITNTTYATGTPEVAVSFIAPTTGRVIVTVGGNLRNNAANADRVGLAPQILLNDSGGTEVLTPTVFRGVCTAGIAVAGDYQGLSRSSLVENLTPGQQYYARVQYIKFGTASTTPDIAGRDISVRPAS